VDRIDLNLRPVGEAATASLFGDERDLEFKLATLVSVLRVAEERKLGFQQVDLRYGERPFLR